MSFLTHLPLNGAKGEGFYLIDESHLIRLSGIVERVTYHNAENGWSVLKVSPFNEPQKLATVVIHQAKVFAGSSMEFWGA